MAGGELAEVAILDCPAGASPFGAQVRARGAKTIVIAEEGDEAVVPFADHLIRVPRTPVLLAPLVTTVPLQVLACEIADTRGFDVDQPRNLAKSVTVE